mmetsp:Transcript_2155/g.5137  ORF Transcript_2155/g.5137 Transcript_2155/m.5137 type:complete len:205 (+) Transcript_2155:96-710(+)
MPSKLRGLQTQASQRQECSQAMGSPEDAALLVAAARQGSAEDVRRLLGRLDPDITAKDGWTPLLAAAAEGHAEVVQVLLDEGADVHRSKDGVSAMQMAFQSGHRHVFKLLFKVNFQTLERATQRRPEVVTVATGARDETVPDAAVQSLREVTRRLVEVGRTQKPFLLHKAPLAPLEAEERGREEAVRGAMKRIALVSGPLRRWR